ncbi:hypothetical protein ABZ694_24645 [Streptomyces albidoflavus]|uniref:phage distal tail protein n=1 Tax=Streptomyces albidoflavus TaxID=1886 RepID=UPI0033EB06CE
MTTPTPLTVGQHQLGSVLIGRGTPVVIADIGGLGRPESRTYDVEPPGEDGVWLGPDLYGGRLITLDAAIKTPGDRETALDVLAELQAEADTRAVRGQAGTTMTLRLAFDGRPVRVARGRVRRLDADLSQAIHGWIPLEVEFQAEDHLWYADEPDTTGMPLGSITAGGMTFPLVFPFVIAGDPAAVGRPGYIQVAGTAETWPVIRVMGPCANPTIRHVTTGRALTVQATIPAGDWVEIDTRPGWRTVLRSNGGSAPLSPASRIDQFVLTPGLNEIRWSATDNTLTSSLAVTWWPAWKAL